MSETDAFKEAFERGKLLKDIKRYEEALVHLQRALGIDPNHLEAAMYLAATYSDMGRNEEALAAIDRALAISPDAEWSHLQRSRILAKLLRRDEALAAAKRAVEVAPASAEAHMRVAWCCYQLNRHAEGLDAAKRAVALDPESAVAWGIQGHIARELRLRPLAITSYRRALELDPGDAWLISNYAKVAPQDEREGLLRRALAIDPTLVVAQQALIDALSIAGKHDEALAMARARIAIRPWKRLDWRSYIYTALCAERPEAIDEAVRAEAKEDEHDDAELAADLAHAARDFPRAEEAYAKALATPSKVAGTRQAIATGNCCCCRMKMALVVLASGDRERALAIRDEAGRVEGHPEWPSPSVGCRCGIVRRLERELGEDA